jgi:hypothetical protein
MCLCAVGCFHATVETGLNPNGQTITQKWASCWILGLVPPKTVEAAAKCPNGVSKVDTQRSFLNGLVGMLTFGIYTPMEIVVQCGDVMGAGVLPTDAQQITILESASSEDIRKAYSDAAIRAYKTSKPVYVRFVQSNATEVGT